MTLTDVGAVVAICHHHGCSFNYNSSFLLHSKTIILNLLASLTVLRNFSPRDILRRKKTQQSG